MLVLVVLVVLVLVLVLVLLVLGGEGVALLQTKQTTRSKRTKEQVEAKNRNKNNAIQSDTPAGRRISFNYIYIYMKWILWVWGQDAWKPEEEHPLTVFSEAQLWPWLWWQDPGVVAVRRMHPMTQGLKILEHDAGGHKRPLTSLNLMKPQHLHLCFPQTYFLYWQ